MIRKTPKYKVLQSIFMAIKNSNETAKAQLSSELIQRLCCVSDGINFESAMNNEDKIVMPHLEVCEGILGWKNEFH